MFEVKSEGLTAAEATALTNIARQVAALAKKAAEGSAKANRGRWFGTKATSSEVTSGLKTMDEYLNKKCKVLTFVRKNTGQIVDAVAAEASDYGQVIPNIMTTTAGFKATPKHTSSGLRIFAMNEIVDAIRDGDRLEQLNYVYHEISHKVLDTVDHKYGQGDCLTLALLKPHKAVQNADNWGYLIAEMD